MTQSRYRTKSFISAAAAMTLGTALIAPFAAQAQQPPSETAMRNVDPERFLSRADLNHDGAVSKSELIESRTRMAERLDQNHDGVINDKDTQRFRRRRANAEQRIEQAVKGFDLNGDGVLQTEEFINGPTTMFDMMDKDHNGLLTEAEMEAAKADFQARRATMQ